MLIGICHIIKMQNKNIYNWTRLYWAPLSISFSKKYNVVGYDINKTRINELKKGLIRTLNLKKYRVKNADFSFDKKIINSDYLLLQSLHQ